MSAHSLLLRLLFDAELRDRFFRDRDAVLAEHPGCEALACLDRAGLELDARTRGRYLMSSLCRPYPLSAGALGAADPDALSAWLASPLLLAPLPERNAAFGAHLDRLARLRGATWLQPVLDWERGLVALAARAREDTPTPVAPAGFSFAPHTLVVEAPWSFELLRGAMEGIDASDAWERIEARRVRPERVATVATARPVPVTLLARAVVGGATLERGASGGVGALIEVRHRTAELMGAQGARLRLLVGGPPDRLSDADRRLGESLVEAGILLRG